MIKHEDCRCYGNDKRMTLVALFSSLFLFTFELVFTTKAIYDWAMIDGWLELLVMIIFFFFALFSFYCSKQ